jgi:hypothetical protein
VGEWWVTKETGDGTTERLVMGTTIKVCRRPPLGLVCRLLVLYLFSRS